MFVSGRLCFQGSCCFPSGHGTSSVPRTYSHGTSRSCYSTWDSWCTSSTSEDPSSSTLNLKKLIRRCSIPLRCSGHRHNPKVGPVSCWQLWCRGMREFNIFLRTDKKCFKHSAKREKLLELILLPKHAHVFLGLLHHSFCCFNNFSQTMMSFWDFCAKNAPSEPSFKISCFTSYLGIFRFTLKAGMQHAFVNWCVTFQCM